MRSGIDATDIDDAASAIGMVLNVRFVPHESEFRGGPYCRAEVPEGALFLQKNTDTPDNEPFEPSWPADKVVLYLDGLSDQAWQTYLNALRTLRVPAVRELVEEV